MAAELAFLVLLNFCRSAYGGLAGSDMGAGAMAASLLIDIETATIHTHASLAVRCAAQRWVPFTRLPEKAL